MSAPPSLVPLAVVTGAHGVRGELRVKLLNPSSDLLTSRASVWLRAGAAAEARRIELRSVHVHQPGLLLLRIDGCHDRDAASALRGSELCVARSELPALEPDEFYLVDLVGLDVQLPDGTKIGAVERTLEYPAAQVACVRVEGGVIEVPLFAPYLVSVDVEQRVVTVQDLGDLELQPSVGPGR